MEQKVETQVPLRNHSIHGGISTRTGHAATLTHVISCLLATLRSHDVPGRMGQFLDQITRRASQEL